MMYLTPDEQNAYDGKMGEALRLATRVVVDLGRLYGAERLVRIEQAHIDGCLYTAVGEAGIEFAERLAGAGARVAVPTTLNITARDTSDWSRFRIPEEHSAKSARLERAYIKMGCIPTWTCAPYQYGIVPGGGQHIAWAESNAICFANSVLGARTERYADLVDICCAILGKAPLFGLHLDAGRTGEVVIQFDMPESVFGDDSMFSAAGYIVGELAQSRVPVVEGIPKWATQDNLKALCAAAASSGAVGLCHMVGITPEARTQEDALGAREPKSTYTVDVAVLTDAAERLGAPGVCNTRVDLVVIGCPHASYDEALQVLSLMGERRVKRDVEFWLFTSRAVSARLEREGLLSQLECRGIKVCCDTCVLQFPLTGWNFSGMATNSGKMAHYAPGICGLNTHLAGLKRCVDAAVSGEVAAG